MNKNNIYINWKNWNSDLFGKTSKLEEAYFGNIIKMLRLKKSPKILEVGFGNGAFLGYLTKKNFNCEGVESNQNLVNLALKNNYSAYQSFSEIDKNNKYDLIVLFDVIEHIPLENIEDFLKDLSIYLNDSGSIFMRFPNGGSPLGLANQHGDVTHCNIITISKLNYWCYNLNLRVVLSKGDDLPFIFKHNYLKMPSRIFRIIFYKLVERIIRIISNQSKGVLSSNLQVIIKKNNGV